MLVPHMLSSHQSWSLSAQGNDMVLKAALEKLRGCRVNYCWITEGVNRLFWFRQ